MQGVSLAQRMPNPVKDTLEFTLLAATEDTEATQAWSACAGIWANQFVASLNEEGCQHWETMLGITRKCSDSLAVRRFRIKTRLNHTLPYTYQELVSTLVGLCGADGFQMTLYPSAYRLSIQLKLTMEAMFDEVEALVRQMVPANMVVEVELQYQQWQDVSALHWGDVTAYSWQQMKEEEIEVE